MKTFATTRWMCAAAGLAICAAGARGQDVTRPGDVVTGIGGTSPAAEAVTNVIDNTANTKYLNFGILNTGFIVTPTGTDIVRAITLITANDAPNRDPASYKLEGSNDNGATFALIAQGSLSPPTARFAFYQATFSNTVAYTQYRVTFPTLSNGATANSMQIAEVQLNTFGNILTTGDGITATLPAGATVVAGQTVARLIDGQLGTVATPQKFGVSGGNLGTTTVDITPAAGGSIVTGIDLFSSELAAPGRTPASVTLLGSNNGTTYTQIFTSPLAQASDIYQDQQFSFPNTTSYTRYRLVLGASSDANMELAEVQLMGTTLGAAPANDLCVNALTVTNGSTSGSNINATGTDVSSCGVGDTADVWFRYVATVTGVIEANTCGAGTLDTVLSVYASCGGTETGCNDNACLGKSRVRFNATSGTPYLIRVGGVGGATGSFTLTIDPAPVVHADVPVTLAYNFNGMVHTGEANDPDNLNGFRALSDRAIQITGTPGSLDVGVEGIGGIPYHVVTQDHVLDLVQLGNRNACDNGNHTFNATANGDITGVQPSWLPNVDQSGPQTTPLAGLNLAMGPNTKVGVIANASNGGAAFQVMLTFTDSSSAVVFIDVPDWFGSQPVLPPEPGAETQSSLGTFFGTSQVDAGTPDVQLNVVEVVISTASLNAAGLGDFTGKQLDSIVFENSNSTISDIGIYAVTVRDGVAVGPAGVCCRGATCNTTFASAAACTGSLGGGAAGAAFVPGSACNSGPVSSAPCCYANYNKANGVTVQDIFDFLSDWFAGSQFASTGGSGSPVALNVQNIFDFLTNWFNGGCS